MKLLYAVLTGLLTATAAAAAPVWYSSSLGGAAESPANASTGTGTAMVSYDADTHMLDISVTFSDLTAPTTASHIHCCTTAPMSGNAGVATETPTFSLFPLGVTAGAFHETYDLTNAASFNGAFVTAQGSVAAAEAALVAGLANGTAYLNIHTAAFPAGEIRGFLAPAANEVPEPATLALLAAGLMSAGLFGAWRLRRKPA